MNTGFSNRDTLKKHLLADMMAEDKKFDFVITALGIGMAATIETYLKRKLARVVGEVEIIAADRANFLLRRYPVETITQISLNLADGNGFVVQDDSFYNSVDYPAGLVMCPEDADVGPYYAQVQFTYNGGFFWEQAEPDDNPFPTPVPNGAAVLPADIQMAWLLQCQHVWSNRDKLGLGVIGKPDQETKLDEIKLIPLVELMLKSHVRMNLV